MAPHISNDQRESAANAQLYLLRKRNALVTLTDALETVRKELIEQARRVATVQGRTATETLSLQELSREYETAAKAIGKLWGYQMGRLERMTAELDEGANESVREAESARAHVAD